MFFKVNAVFESELHYFAIFYIPDSTIYNFSMFLRVQFITMGHIEKNTLQVAFEVIQSGKGLLYLYITRH